MGDTIRLLGPVGEVQNVAIGPDGADGVEIDLGIGPAGGSDGAFGDNAGGGKPLIRRAKDAAGAGAHP